MNFWMGIRCKKIYDIKLSIEKNKKLNSISNTRYSEDVKSLENSYYYQIKFINVTKICRIII